MNDNLLIEDKEKLWQLILEVQALEEAASKLQRSMLGSVEFAGEFWHDRHYDQFKEDWQKFAGYILDCHEQMVEQKKVLVDFYRRHFEPK